MALFSLAVLALAVMPLQAPPAAPPAAPQAKKSLFQRVIEHPTGQNGYEDYVRAAEIVESSEQINFYNFLSLVVATPRANEFLRRTVKVPPLLTWESTPLQIRQEYVKRFGLALELVRQGNRKKVWQPRGAMDLNTALPELGAFKSLAKLFLERSKVEFATGSPASAVSTLLDGLAFSDKFSDGPLIFPLVSMVCQGILMVGFEGCMGRLSLQDCQSVVKAVNELLSGPNPLIGAVAWEVSSLKSAVAGMIADPSQIPLLVGEDPDGPEIQAAVQGLKPADRERLQALVQSRLGKRFEEDRRLLLGPESEWPQAAKAQETASRTDLATVDDLASAIMGRVSPVRGGSIGALVRRRAQLRVLRTAARIMAYRWTFDKVPDKLEQALPESELIDPSNGGPFQYEVLGPGIFRVYSKGFGDSGPISIRYTFPSGRGEDTGLRPPR